jgi:hypothetical protein
MKTCKLILPPHLYKMAKQAASERGQTLHAFCQQFTPVPCEVFVQKRMPKPKPDLRSIPFWNDVESALDKSTGFEP